MDFSQSKALLDDLQRSLARVQLHHGELVSMISWCMDEIYGLAKSGEDNDRKMELVALEHRARLLLDRWKKQGLN